MENEIRSLLGTALGELFGPEAAAVNLVLEVPRDRSHGDLATNVAMSLARTLKKPPRKIAEELVAYLEGQDTFLESITIAGPGFINFRIGSSIWHHSLADILKKKTAYGRSQAGEDFPVMVEYVSANPTGPLNVVNARAAAFGDTLVRLFDAAGYKVASEFYINDVGRQIDLLGESLLARYEQVQGRGDGQIPEDGYQGEYLVELARELDAKEIDASLADKSDSEKRDIMSRHAVEKLRAWQEKDLKAYGTQFDRWFYQHELYPQAVEDTFKLLQEKGLVEERDGAQWFRATQFGDDQDRVLIRANGDPTYFLADLAYHTSKESRGIKRSIDIWGPDHHGYIERMQSAMEALGFGRDWLEVLIVQQVNLLSDGKQVKMSKRKGEFITLQDLIEEVGKDAARFFFLQRRAESHLDFDLDLAKKENDENPVFYVKYAHARISGVIRKATEQGVSESQDADLSLLKEAPELALIKVLHRFPAIIASAAAQREPHRLTTYLREVAQAFHLFYHECRVISDNSDLTSARLALCRASQIVVSNGLSLMDISAPERM